MATAGAGGRAYRRRVLIDIGAVGQVDEDGVHVLHIRDDDSQVGQCRQRSGFVLILGRNAERARVHSIRLEGVLEHTCMHPSVIYTCIQTCYPCMHKHTHQPLHSHREALVFSERFKKKMETGQPGDCGAIKGAWADLLA